MSLNINYINRDDLWVGEVAFIGEIGFHKLPNNHTSSQNNDLSTKQLVVKSYYSCRSILFIIDEQKSAIDLLYKSPNYPILNTSDYKVCLNSGIIIQNICNLGMLLQHFGYDEYLYHKDLKNIRKTFFNGKFAKDHCELFGYKELMADDFTFYLGEKEITDPKELKRIHKNYMREQKLDHRSFKSVPNNVLPREYFTVLNERGNKSFEHFFTEYCEHIDSFKPSVQEGYIKKLSIFKR